MEKTRTRIKLIDSGRKSLVHIDAKSHDRNDRHEPPSLVYRNGFENTLRHFVDRSAEGGMM